MNKEMQQILIDIFPLVVEVNFNTEYRANIDIQPTFEGHYQIWLQLSNNNEDFHHSRTAFWNNEIQFKRKMKKFKNELLKILGRHEHV